MTGWRKRQIQMEQDKPMVDLEQAMKDKVDKYYTAGWNAALEAAAAKTDEFKPAFGDDTCASWAVWLRGMKQ